MSATWGRFKLRGAWIGLSAVGLLLVGTAGAADTPMPTWVSLNSSATTSPGAATSLVGASNGNVGPSNGGVAAQSDLGSLGLKPVTPGAFTDVAPGEAAPPTGMRSWVAPSASETALEPWNWQVLPDGLIYKSYLAGQKEPRMGSVWNHLDHHGWVWDISLGGRVGILRHGSSGPERPQGFQIDLEGGAMPRLDLEHDRDLMSADFRAGVPITFGNEWWQTKLAYYHLSSHLGDEFMLRNPGFPRINYSRDVLVWGNSVYPTSNLRLYAEAGWAFCSDGGSDPWEFQFGIDYSPVGGADSIRGTPFVALNGHLRQEVDFGGNFVVQTGWQWRGTSGHLFRLGVQYNTGKSEQLEIFSHTEEKFGVGIWYDY
jgi:hypothetical protein